MTYYLGGVSKSMVAHTCVARFKCKLTGLTLVKKKVLRYKQYCDEEINN